jgi:hypothetical protein
LPASSATAARIVCWSSLSWKSTTLSTRDWGCSI